MTRTVLITGGARRIGSEIARKLAVNGWNVAIHFNHSEAEASDLVAELRSQGYMASSFQSRLDTVEDCERLFRDVNRELGNVHGLVNNAAHFEFDRAHSPDWHLWDLHLNVNVRAAIQLAYLLHTQPAPDDSRPRCVVNMLDQKIFNLNPDFFSYTISKIALEGATRLQAKDFAPNTRVCAVAPGLTMQSGDQSESNFEVAHTITPMGRSSTPTDIAEAVLFLLDARSVTGSTLIVDGGQHLIPLSRDVMFEVKA